MQMWRAPTPKPHSVVDQSVGPSLIYQKPNQAQNDYSTPNEHIFSWCFAKPPPNPQRSQDRFQKHN